MKKELTPKEILFDIDLNCGEGDIELKDIPQIKAAYEDIKNGINIDEDNFNIYLVESFSRENVDNLVNYLKDLYKNKDKPQDICYVTFEDDKCPKVIFLGNGRGKNFCISLNNIKERYVGIYNEFNNSSGEDEKDIILEYISSKKSNYINELINISKKEGFDVKASNGGFAFIPLKDGKAMTEREYDELTEDRKDKIILKASELKNKAEKYLEKIKNIEAKSINRLKEIFLEYLNEELQDYKHSLLIEYILDNDAYDYLEKVFTAIENQLLDNYSINFDDEDENINRIMDMYDAYVLVDNSNCKNPRVIYEENPTVTNLLGNIEYENQNGGYDTNMSLITPGSLVLANEGCIVIRLNDLIINNFSYFALKKILLSGKVNIESCKNYYELLSLNSIKPEPINVKVKVVLIGDYESYEVLYNSDEDFKKIFPIVTEIKKEIKLANIKGEEIKNIILNRAKKNGIDKISEEVIKEIAKYLCRLTDNKLKILMDTWEIDKIIIFVKNKNILKGKESIDKEDIIEYLYLENNLENEISDMYKEEKIIVSTKGKKVGVINGLAVIDTGVFRFGRPIRISCIVYKGSGRIHDVQKESNLSGNIHEKAISIINSLLINFINPYEFLPVDFHLCFEQTYGIVEGDSAQVAEIIAMISALTKIEIKQNIAVTGALNQLGEVQAIGGVNEKIEGFYKVSKNLGKVLDSGVLIPYSNKNEIVLNNQVEEDIDKGNFHIYTMETLEDALEIMLDTSILEINNKIKVEIEKYKANIVSKTK